MKRIDMIPQDGRADRLAREVEAVARRVVERGRATVIGGLEGMTLGDLRLVNLEGGGTLLVPDPKAGADVWRAPPLDGRRARRILP